jgi:hypothetical protein
MKLKTFIECYTMQLIGLLLKKGTTQSCWGTSGHLIKATNEWKRMNAMDVSDVYYDKFLVKW